MQISPFELELIYDATGATPEERQTINAAIPVLKKLIGHINDNKALLATLIADGQLLVPAAQIIINALPNQGGSS